MRGPQDRERHAAARRDLLLGDLRAEVSTVGHALAADDRQCHVVTLAGARSASSRLRDDVRKKSSTAGSSHTGALETSTTTAAPTSPGGPDRPA
jgi:hypothetical protein